MSLITTSPTSSPRSSSPGVQKAGAADKVNAVFIGPTGANADNQISEIETLMSKMDGLAISSVSSDALGPVIDRV